MPRILARIGLWPALAFVLNLTWEIAHVGLYALWAQADGPRIAWSVFHCSLGDVALSRTATVHLHRNSATKFNFT